VRVNDGPDDASSGAHPAGRAPARPPENHAGTRPSRVAASSGDGAGYRSAPWTPLSRRPQIGLSPAERLHRELEAATMTIVDGPAELHISHLGRFCIPYTIRP